MKVWYDGRGKMKLASLARLETTTQTPPGLWARLHPPDQMKKSPRADPSKASTSILSSEPGDGAAKPETAHRYFVACRGACSHDSRSHTPVHAS